MRKNIKSLRTNIIQQGWLKLLILVMALLPMTAFSQEDSTAKAEAEEPETMSPMIEFVSLQKADQTIELKAIFKAKIDGAISKLEGLKVEFFAVSDSDAKIGEAVTNRNGIAIINLKADGLTADTAGKLNFKVSYAGTDKIDAAEEVLAIKRARLEITPVKEDSLLTINVKLIDLSTGTETPVTETELGIYVKRLFNPLKIGEGTTDEAGEASIEIPNDLPGDVNGNLTFIAKVLENEDYGNLETSVVQKWGQPVSNEMKAMPRALWSPHPPMWMLITFIVLMGTVWGHYVVIIYELFRLRGEH